MNAELVLTRLRNFLLGFSAFIFVGTLAELIFIQHTQEPLQITPFVLSVMSLLVIGAAYFRPSRQTLLALRANMVLVTLGSLVGMFFHIRGNLELALEVHPNLTAIERITSALGGANPLMAPGVLAMAGILAAAATYYHPALQSSASRSAAKRMTAVKNR